ncbi:MAG: ribonuclease HI [Bacteroidales bacterium]|nr:ribonuclease HI [Bacteroidales bacterium]
MAETIKEKPLIQLFTDGASSGNPGPGGYGAILRCGPVEKELSGGFRITTNNRMELLAVIMGLEAVKWENARIHVVSDSSYVVKAVNEGWLFNWERKGFAKVRNPDLWMRFLAVYRRHRVSFEWVHGHAGHPENERCDALAVAAGAGAAASGVQLPEDGGYIEQEAASAAGTLL